MRINLKESTHYITEYCCHCRNTVSWCLPPFGLSNFLGHVKLHGPVVYIELNNYRRRMPPGRLLPGSQVTKASFPRANNKLYQAGDVSDTVGIPPGLPLMCTACVGERGPELGG